MPVKSPGFRWEQVPSHARLCLPKALFYAAFRIPGWHMPLLPASADLVAPWPGFSLLSVSCCISTCAGVLSHRGLTAVALGRCIVNRFRSPTAAFPLALGRCILLRSVRLRAA